MQISRVEAKIDGIAERAHKMSERISWADEFDASRPSTTDPIVVTYGFDRKLFPRAIMAFWFSAVPRASLSFRLIFWLVVWLGALAGVIFVGAVQIPAYQAWGAAAVIVAVWILILQRVRMNRFYNVLGEHWTRTGDMTARFDDIGVEIHQKGSRMQFKWDAIDAITRAKGGTVFRIGMTMIAIPDYALPQDMNPKKFRDRLAKWKDL